MDLLTPAEKWATRSESQGDAPRPMPLLQQLTMFVSVVAPIAGLIIAIVIFWHRGPASVGWPEIVAMLGIYALTGYGVTIGFHRLLTHRSFDTPRAVKIFFAICGSMAAQGAFDPLVRDASPASSNFRS